MAEMKLVDFDWNLEFVMGSSAVSTVDQPLLHLRLNVGPPAASNGAPTASSCTTTAFAPLDVELDRSQLQSLISQLETALSG